MTERYVVCHEHGDHCAGEHCCCVDKHIYLMGPYVEPSTYAARLETIRREWHYEQSIRAENIPWLLDLVDRLLKSGPASRDSADG